MDHPSIRQNAQRANTGMTYVSLAARVWTIANLSTPILLLSLVLSQQASAKGQCELIFTASPAAEALSPELTPGFYPQQERPIERLHVVGHDGRLRDRPLSPEVSSNIVDTEEMTGRASSQRPYRPEANLQYNFEYSPDGRFFTTIERGSRVQIRFVSTGKVATNLRRHQGRVLVVSFSPDGDHVLTAAEDHTMHVSETSTGSELFAVRGSTVFVKAFFHPDGERILTLSEDNQIRIWKGRKTLLAKRFKKHMRVAETAFNEDGSIFLIRFARQEFFVAYRTDTGRRLGTATSLDSPITADALSADGRLAPIRLEGGALHFGNVGPE